mgnify:FL=1
MKNIVRTFALALLAAISLTGLLTSPASAGIVGGSGPPQYPLAPAVTVTSVGQSHVFTIVGKNPGPRFYPTIRYDYQFVVDGVPQPVKSANVSGNVAMAGGVVSASSYSVTGPFWMVPAQNTHVVTITARTANSAGVGPWSSPLLVLEYWELY